MRNRVHLKMIAIAPMILCAIALLAPTQVAFAADEAKAESFEPTISAAGQAALDRMKGLEEGSSRPVEVLSLEAAAELMQKQATKGVSAVHTGPLRKMPPLPDSRGHGEEYLIPNEPTKPDGPTKAGPAAPGYVQTTPGLAVSAPTAAGVSFEGVGTGIPGFVPSGNPPDTNGHVGATQYVQWNNTSFAVWDKSGNRLYGPAAGNTLFQALGGACASHNDGDPVVDYDIQSGRWILAQFVVGFSPTYSHECVAISQTQDATGGYYLYDFTTDATNFVDYPKIGVWTDAYYMSGHVFAEPSGSFNHGTIFAFERSAMIAGQTARMQSVNLPGSSFGFLPSDLDSLTPPPAGSQEFVIGPTPGVTNKLDAYRVVTTWGVTPTITLTSYNGSANGITATFNTAPCDSTASRGRSCVPQDTASPYSAVATDDIDALTGHLMYRLAYFNFGGSPAQESLVANGTVQGSASSPAHGAIEWYEFRSAGGANTKPTLFQSGTYDPTVSYRFMGSIAMDQNHNVALGYSKSYTNIPPEIDITGRLGTDTVGTMGAEAQVMPGAGVQKPGSTAGWRWGDYSAMTLDPVDQCTFWYTNEYLPNNGAFNWNTRIASYTFAPGNCTPSTWGTVTGHITDCNTGEPIQGVIVTLSPGGYAGATDVSGNYSITAPPGSYTATAADPGRNCTGSTPSVSGTLTVAASGTQSQDFCMAGGSNLQITGFSIDDSTTGNNNGVINANECVKVFLTVQNQGCADESSILSSVTTSTAHVTITQGTSAYPDLIIDASAPNKTAFRVTTDSSFVCGTPIALTLNLTYAGGSKSVGTSLPTCAGGADQTIPSSSVTSGVDPSQPDRLGRTGNPSTCSGKPCPGPINTAGTRNYKTFTFANNGGVPACITVTINAACGSASDVSGIAYQNAYVAPVTQGDALGHLCLNYLGDTGISALGSNVAGSPASGAFSFDAAANANFVVVVATNTGGQSCSQFSGTVSGFFDTTPGPGACPTCNAPTATASVSGSNPICNGSSTALLGSGSGGSGSGYSCVWSPATGLSSVTSCTPTANPTVTTTYNLTISDSNGCFSTNTAQATVNVNNPPTTATAGGTQTICPLGTTGGLGGNTPTSGSGTWTVFSGGTGTFSPNAGAPNATFTQTGGPGPIVLHWTISDPPCTPDSVASVTVTVIGSIAVNGSTAPASVCATDLGGLATVQAPDSGTVLFQWGYRTVSGGPIKDLAGHTGSTYTLQGSDFGGPGTYYLVCEVTSSECGTFVSNEIQVTVNPGPCAETTPPDVQYFTGTTRNGAGSNILQWFSAATPVDLDKLYVRIDGQFPIDPDDPDATFVASVPAPANTRFTFTDVSVANGTTSSYSLFSYTGSSPSLYSSGKDIPSRPFNSPAGIKWVFASGGITLSTPGVRPLCCSPQVAGAIYTTSNTRNIDAMNLGPLGGDWPTGWIPFAMNAPAPNRAVSNNLNSTLVGGSKHPVFAGSSDGRVYAVDGQTGSLLWVSPVLGDYITAPPSTMFSEIHGGAPNAVMVGANSATGNKFYGLNITNGSILWTFSNGVANNIGVISGQALVDYTNNRAYFTSRAGGSGHTVWALNMGITPPTLLWTANTDDVDADINMASNTLYVGTTTGKVVALNLNGTTKWLSSYSTGDGPIKGLIWASGTKLYFSTTSNVNAINDNGSGTNATSVWTHSVSSPTTPLVYNNQVYVGGGDGKAYSINVTTASATTVTLGDPSTPFQVGSPTRDSSNNLLLFGSEPGHVYAVVPF